MDQTVQIGQELTRIAITWPEYCQDCLYAGIAKYQKDKNSYDFLNKMAILAQTFDQEPQTLSEREFISQYYGLFKSAWEDLKRSVLDQDRCLADQATTRFLELFNKLKTDVMG